MFDAGTDHDNQCPGCGEVLRAQRNGWNWSTKRFCSEGCRDRYLTKSTRGLCPECGGRLYAKGEVRSKGRLKRFCSDPCKAAYNARREHRALVLYDLVMGRKYDTDHPLHAALDTTIRRLRDGWHREDHPKNRPAKRTWYDWERHVPEDIRAKTIAPQLPVLGPGDPEFDRQVAESVARAKALRISTAEPNPPAPPESRGPPHPVSVFQRPRVVVQKRTRRS